MVMANAANSAPPSRCRTAFNTGDPRGTGRAARRALMHTLLAARASHQIGIAELPKELALRSRLSRRAPLGRDVRVARLGSPRDDGEEPTISTCRSARLST